jgi:predicted DNA-binding antitoxin AbrB/MazE fold protein
MGALKAIVRNGRLVLDEPTDLPEGSEVEVALVTEETDPELLAELDASADDEKAGRLADMKDVLARLGSTP